MTATTSAGAGQAARRPNWVDADRYPFDPHWTELPAGKVHYVDESPSGAEAPESSTGSSESAGTPTVVFVHGNPTWSFLYRRLVRGLSDEYRCVAPDLLGFGLSDAPAAFSYRPAAQAHVLEGLVDSLGLEDVALVVHDWGGPIGMDYATRHPDRVTGVVAMNTWCWPRSRSVDRLESRVTDTAFARRLVVAYDAFTWAAIAPLVAALAVRGRWRQATALARQYRGPHSTPRARLATWILAREVARSSEWLAGIWRRRRSLRDTPVRLFWGRRDPIHGSFFRRWQSAFEDVRTTVYGDVGHFVPEEKGRELTGPIRRFLEGR